MPVVNLQGTYHIGKHVEIFARVVNLLDKQYATAGFLTTNTFNPNGTFRSNPSNWTNENAVSPGTPRALGSGRVCASNSVPGRAHVPHCAILGRAPGARNTLGTA